MKKLSQLTLSFFIVLNIVAVLILILTAYSPYLNPDFFPISSNLGLGFPIVLFVNILFILFWLIFKYKGMKYSVIGLLIIAPQIFKYTPYNIQRKPPQEAIKIISYNVMSFNGFKKEADGKNNILEYLKKSNADIICMQEYNVSKNKKQVTQQDVQKALSRYPYHNIQAVGDRGSGNKLAIYSKYPISNIAKIDYKSAYNGSIAYTVNIDGNKTLIINNHFESNKITMEDKVVYERILKMEDKTQIVKDTKGLVSKIVEASSIRQKQAKKVDNVVKISKLPFIIVCGDFNDSPLCYTNRLLEETLDNAFVKSSKGLGISYNQNKFYFRIDNILISRNLKAYNCMVDKSIKDSDHYPIWCYIARK